MDRHIALAEVDCRTRPPRGRCGLNCDLCEIRPCIKSYYDGHDLPPFGNCRCAKAMRGEACWRRDQRTAQDSRQEHTQVRSAHGRMRKHGKDASRSGSVTRARGLRYKQYGHVSVWTSVWLLVWCMVAVAANITGNTQTDMVDCHTLAVVGNNVDHVENTNIRTRTCHTSTMVGNGDESTTPVSNRRHSNAPVTERNCSLYDWESPSERLHRVQSMAWSAQNHTVWRLGGRAGLAL